ncbi:MFS transporter [Haloferax sp. Atlit-6N]|uniref:Sugar transporter n=1 Tax=Haloferax gibbonsii (strain ATCC 33959 / DSM 4427 / JCM 8863 / NBRC 102184 / NCIMB 2188 / Ma 2.38) TaxID=1227459 RepID=M0HAR0_HALGM|nr:MULTISPECIES: MFS transporter [Haloferax]ELZ81631.1 putative sugar transporter [Haloferax gibbonsii ATCC 33959]RDZ52013.1 MFS transporter [Haloferax sp. Atlit-4N]REA01319.1 MFS transporter [Haloferax sp. Atlit-6N]
MGVGAVAGDVNRNDRSIVALVMLAHGMVHTYELSIPIFVAIWLGEFASIDLGIATIPVTTASLGVMTGLGFALFGLGALPGGILVDRVGSKRLIVACLLGMAGSFVLLALSPNLVVVALALVVWGAAASVYHPAGLRLISTGVEERGTGFAYHGIAGNLGIGFGPFLTALLLLFFDWHLVAGVLALPALVAAALATRANFEEQAAVAATDGGDGSDTGGDDKAGAGVSSFAELVSQSKHLFAGGFALVFALVMFSGLYYRGVTTFLPDLLGSVIGIEPIPVSELLPAALASGSAGGAPTLDVELFVYAGLLTVGVFGQYVGGKLTDRIRTERGIVAGFGALAVIAVAFLPVASLGVGPLLAVCALLGFFLFMVQPFYQATVAEYTPAGLRGLSYGFTYLGVFGVGALGGAVAGYILTVADSTALFLVLAGFATAATLLGVTLLRRRPTPA